MAIRSRWISLVPPPKVRITRLRGVHLEATGQDGVVVAPGQVAGLSHHLQQQPEGLHVELGAEDLDGRGVGHVEVTLRRRPGHLPVDQLEELEAGVDAGQVDLDPLLVDHPPPVGQLGVLGPGADVVECPLDDARRAQGHPLVVQLVRDEGPSGVLLTDPVAGRHTDILVERVVDVVVAQKMHGDDLDPGRVHGDDEDGDALVLGHLGVGAGGQPDVVGPSGQRRVDLLAVDDVLVTVAHGPRLERGQVGARLGLGVTDAEVDVTGQDLREEEVLLLLRAELHDGRTDGVDGQHGHRRPGTHRLVEEDVLLDGRAALAAVLGRPPDAQPAVLGHLLDHASHVGPDAVTFGQLRLDLGGEQVGVVLTQPVPERLLFVGVADLHGSLPIGACTCRPRWATPGTPGGGRCL